MTATMRRVLRLLQNPTKRPATMETPTARDRCWRCDTKPAAPRSPAGLCTPCATQLRGPQG